MTFSVNSEVTKVSNEFDINWPNMSRHPYSIYSLYGYKPYVVLVS